MFDFIRRLFGPRNALAFGAPPPGAVAAITVQGYGTTRTASSPATLYARDSTGAALLTAAVNIVLDPALSALLGPGRSPSDFAEGRYGIGAILPAPADAAGMAQYGPGRLLQLDAQPQEGAPPPPFSRAVLLIHGGAAASPTDGSIRMADADLASLLALLPDDLAQVAVQLIRMPDTEADTTETAGNDRLGGDPYGEGLRERGAPPSDAAAPADGDAAAAAALAELGYGVQADGGVAADILGPPGDMDGGWTPSGGAYGP